MAHQQFPGGGWVQIILAIGILEAGPLSQQDDAAPGDLGWKYFGVKYEDGDEKVRTDASFFKYSSFSLRI